jgi:hypothetical protein
MGTQQVPSLDGAKLELESMHVRHSGLTPPMAGVFCEAASVCLNRHHESPAELEIVRKEGTTTRLVEFRKPDARALNAWANDIDATENGAYGVCLAAVEVEERLVAVRRAETLTGADWYVAPVGAEAKDLESCLRLEVSGIDKGNRSAIIARLAQKVRQARRGANNLPAIASVVGFKEKAVVIQKVSDGE